MPGKSSTLKDLSDMKQGMGKNCEDLDCCVNVLREKYNTEINILKDEENNFKGMFIQTCSMKKTMKAYPEFLGIDVAEDGNCQTEIVCLCLLTTEDKNSSTWFLETFRDNNIASQRTKCIMTDKDLLERSVIRDVCPEVNLTTNMPIPLYANISVFVNTDNSRFSLGKRNSLHIEYAVTILLADVRDNRDWHRSLLIFTEELNNL
nr:unnamed protein product [Callosobruchus chinensis]